MNAQKLRDHMHIIAMSRHGRTEKLEALLQATILIRILGFHVSIKGVGGEHVFRYTIVGENDFKIEDEIEIGS